MTTASCSFASCVRSALKVMLDDVQTVRAAQSEIQLIKWRLVPKTWPGQFDFVKMSAPMLVSIVPRPLCAFAFNSTAIDTKVILSLRHGPARPVATSSGGRLLDFAVGI